MPARVSPSPDVPSIATSRPPPARRALVALFATALLALTATACGGDDGEPTGTGGGPAAEEDSPDSPSGAAKKRDPTPRGTPSRGGKGEPGPADGEPADAPTSRTDQQEASKGLEGAVADAVEERTGRSVKDTLCGPKNTRAGLWSCRASAGGDLYTYSLSLDDGRFSGKGRRTSASTKPNVKLKPRDLVRGKGLPEAPKGQPLPRISGTYR